MVGEGQGYGEHWKDQGLQIRDHGPRLHQASTQQEGGRNIHPGEKKKNLPQTLGVSRAQHRLEVREQAGPLERSTWAPLGDRHGPTRKLSQQATLTPEGSVTTGSRASGTLCH